MKNYKKIALRIIPIVVFALISAVIIAYQHGVFDITFIERPIRYTQDEKDTIPPEVPDATDTKKPDDTENIGRDTENPPPPADEDAIKTLLTNIISTENAAAQGYKVTDLAYGDNFIISLATSKLTSNGEYSNYTRKVLVPERIPDEVYNTYSTKMTEKTVDVPAAEVYMDYILVSDAGKINILSKEGHLLASDFDLAKYTPAYTRDKNDNALFKCETPSKTKKGNTVTTYYYLDESGNLVESDYNDKLDNRGLYINYPTYYGKTDNNLYRYYSKTDDKYGYGNEKGVMKSSFFYLDAYNFSEGLAMVVDEDERVNYLGTSLYKKIAGYKQIFISKRRVRSHYIMPDTRGEESIGFFYFENGLCRIRRQIVDAFHWEEYGQRWVASDEDIIIRKDGSQFPVPTDFSPKAYSNGMILLERDGKFGYMDYTGKWIVQPTLDFAAPFYEGLAVVSSGGKYGLIDTSGEYVLPLDFDHIQNVSGGIIAVYESNYGWLIFNKLVK